MYSRELRTFLLAAEKGSFTRAAEALFLTPAAVMKQMNQLETRLGLTLFIRTSQGASLTEAGRIIYEAARRIAAESEEAVLAARAAEARSAQTLRVGSSFLNPGQRLIDLWHRLAPEDRTYRFRLVPYDDDRRQILSVVASLGSRVDFLAGVFDSQRMAELADFLELRRCPLCIAVPRSHPLARKRRLALADLHGQRLFVVRSGDARTIDRVMTVLKMTHPQILFQDAGWFYDMDTFNTCEMTGSLLLTLDIWAGVHPSLVTLPVEWPYTVPWGLLYAKHPSPEAARFLDALREKQDEAARTPL